MYKKQSKRMSRRDFLRVSAMSTAGMLAAACVQPAPVAQEVVEEAPAMPEAMEFTLLSLDGVGWNEANTVLIEAFEEKTGHKGKLWGAGWPIRNSTLPAIAAGTPPDVFHDMPGQISHLYADGTVLNLNSLMEKSPWNPEDLSPLDMQACTWFGKIKQMPLWHDLSGQSFYVYRTDFF
jgi:ABC-type glycerol-3-phosphate transport system substrate-binding protein